MTAEDCRRWRESLGAYTMGQLDAEARGAVDAHLQRCPDCRAEAQALAPLPGLLALTDPSHLEARPAPPASLVERIAATITAERARRRRMRVRLGIGVAAAATATAAVLAALVALGGDGDNGPAAEPPTRVSFEPLPPGASIAARLEPTGGGTVIRIGVDGLRSGTLCRVFLRRRDGVRIAAGSFRYSSAPGDDAVLRSGMELSEASALVLVAGRWTYTAQLR